MGAKGGCSFKTRVVVDVLMENAVLLVGSMNERMK